jgi:condensin complex subunit 2
MKVVQEEMRKDEEEQNQKNQKRENIEGDNTLEKNLSNIDTNKYDLEFDVDPLFQKTSAKFDEGGAKGLLMNNLFVISS